MESSWITIAPISRLPGPHWKDTKERGLKAQAVMSDLQSTLILSPLAVWPRASLVWASVSFSEKNGTKRVTGRIKWDKVVECVLSASNFRLFWPIHFTFWPITFTYNQNKSLHFSYYVECTDHLTLFHSIFKKLQVMRLAWWPRG